VEGQEVRRKKSARLYKEITNRRNHGAMCEFIILRWETSIRDHSQLAFENIVIKILTIL
jgi:hypothetical protein